MRRRPETKIARARVQPESRAFLDASDAQSIRLLASNPEFQPHPPVTGAASLAEAHAAVIAMAAAGDMTTRQRLDFSTMLEYRRRAVETFEIEREVEELYAERRKPGGGKP